MKKSSGKTDKSSTGNNQMKTSKSDNLLHNVLEALEHPFFIVNVRGYTVQKANKKAHDGSIPDGITCSELTNSCYSQCKPKTCPVRRAKKSKGHVITEYSCEKDGVIRHFKAHGHPICDTDGKIRQVFVYILDITSYTQIEQALRKSESRYIGFLQKFRGVAYHGDLNWTPLFFHGAVEEITGYTEEEFITKKVTLDSIIHPDDWSNILKSDAKLRSIPGYSEERFYRLRHKDGEIRWIHDIIEVIKDDSGEYNLVQGVMYDITVQKEIEKEREQHQRELELYSSLLRHDLSNDIQVMLGYAEIIQMLSVGMNDERSSLLNRLIAGIMRMRQVLLAFGPHYPWQGGKILTLMNQIAANAEGVHKDLTVKVSVTKGGESIILGSGRLLPMVFDNLIRNIAIHAGPDADAEISVSREGNYAHILVSDNGLGIPPEIQKILFQKGTSTRGGGLGLYLARDILETYGGSIKLVKSKIGKGTTFLVKIPIEI